NWDDRRAGGINRERLHLVAGNICLFDCLASGKRQSIHLIVMRLRCVFRILSLTMQRVFGKRGREETSFAVYNRDANIQSPEINSSNNCHKLILASTNNSLLCVRVHIPVKVSSGRFMNGGRHRREISGNVMLETVLTNVAEQFLQPGDLHYTGTSKGFQRVIGETATA